LESAGRRNDIESASDRHEQPQDATRTTVPVVAPLRIGSLELETPILQAPIAGFTDLVFRRIVRELGGCGLIYTEMISAGGWVKGNIPPDRLIGVKDEPRPLGVQLWDREPEMVEEAAGRLADLDVSVIDLNFGCPKKRIMGKQGSGAQLLRDPATVGRMVEATKRGAGDIPVTAKIRLGPTSDLITAVEVARVSEQAGAAAITVHGRTARDGYGIPVARDRIAEVVEAVAIPVIANGDIVDAASALEILEYTGAAGVMVARRCLSAPWVFREIAAAFAGEPIPPPPALEQQREQLLRHHQQLVEVHGDPLGTVLIRKFAARYLAGVKGAKAFRAQVTGARDAADFRRIVDALFPTGDEIEPDVAGQSLVEESCE